MGGSTAGRTGLSVVVRRGVDVPEGTLVDALGVVLPDGRSAVPLGVALPEGVLTSTDWRGVNLPGADVASVTSCLAIGCQAPGTAARSLSNERNLIISLLPFIN